MEFFNLYSEMKSNGHNVKLIYDVKSQSIQLSNNGKVFFTKPLKKPADKLQKSGLASVSPDPVNGLYGKEVNE